VANTEGITAREVLKKLSEWAVGPHGPECAGIVCRHSRAQEAIVQVGNAMSEISEDRRRCPRCNVILSEKLGFLHPKDCAKT
jgi:uncharacterized protein with PIN domain